MKALIGLSAVLVAALNSSGAALERASSEEPPPSAIPADIRLAQTGTVDLPTARVAGMSGTRIPLNLTTPASGIRFIKMNDFPDELQLSRGFRLRGAWITSVLDLENLELVAPADFAKTFKIDVLYFRNNQAPAVARRVLTIEIELPEAVISNTPASEESKAVRAAAPEPPAPTPTPRPHVTSRKTLTTEQEVDSLERGARLMRNGDIAAARLLYEDLAVSGSAKGARALAETYDPAYLKGVFTAGLRPNPEKARIWYELAAELGDTVSMTRLSAQDRR